MYLLPSNKLWLLGGQLLGTLLGLLFTAVISRHSPKVFAQYGFIQSNLEFTFGLFSLGAIGVARKNLIINPFFVLVGIVFSLLFLNAKGLFGLDVILLVSLTFLFKVLYESVSFFNVGLAIYFRSFGRIVLFFLPIYLVILGYYWFVCIPLSLLIFLLRKNLSFDFSFSIRRERVIFSLVSALSVIAVYFDKVFFFQRLEITDYNVLIVISKVALPVLLLKSLFITVFGKELREGVLSRKRFFRHLVLANSLTFTYILFIYCFAEDALSFFGIESYNDSNLVYFLFPFLAYNISVYSGQYLQLHGKEVLVLVTMALSSVVPVALYVLLESLTIYYTWTLVMGVLSGAVLIYQVMLLNE